MKLIRKTKSCVEIDICGYNLERTLNFLCGHGVDFLEIKKHDLKNATVQIKPANKNYVVKYLTERKFEIKSIKYRGFCGTLDFFKHRVGIIIGIFVLISFLIVMNNFLFNIQINGCEKISSDEIVNLLNENGYKNFTNLNSVDTKKIEKLVLDNFSQISMCSAIVRGNSIVINVKEKILNEEYENLGKLSPLLATQNGLITEIDLIQGTVLVKVGDIVKVGDPLVAPYTLDSNGKQIPIVPKAKILAEVWISGESEHEECVAKQERTGKFVSFRQTTINNATIFSNIKEQVPFENFEKEEKTTYLTNYILPIKYKEIFYYETKSVIIEKKFEDVKQQKIDEAKKVAMLQVENNQILNENFDVVQKDGKFVVNYVITIKKDIAF